MAQSDLLMVNLVQNIRSNSQLDSADSLKTASFLECYAILFNGQK